jgi:hypothetical protein
MIELVATAASVLPVPTATPDRLDHVISGVAARDRAAFRRLYAFMAMRVWHMVTEAPLCAADAVAVMRSTFVEVWHSAGAAARYDARDWMAMVTAGRIDDRLSLIDANGRGGVHPAEPAVAAGRQHQAPAVADYDANVHRELIALLGSGRATIRTSPGTFVRVDDLDHALATIVAATRAAVAGPQLIGRIAAPHSASHATKARQHSHVHRQS